MLHDPPTTETPLAEASELIELSEATERARERLYQQLLKIGDRFVERRTALANGEFCGLNLIVRKRGKSVSAVWANFHFKNGKRSGITNLPKVKGSPSYDLFTIGRNTPEWLYGAAVAIEMEVRPIRETLYRLTDIDRALGVMNARSGGIHFAALPGSEADHSTGYGSTDPLDPLDPSANI